MAVPYSNTRLRVPKGFQNVLEGLAREVLRCQPENIYSFAADYFEELLRMRQETGYDDIALLGAKLEDRFYNNHSFKNPNTNTNNEEQQSAAVKIQSEYRRFAAKKEVDTKKEEEAAIVIQASFRGHIERQSQNPNSIDETDGVPSDAPTNQHNNTDMEENTLIHPNIDEPEIMDKDNSNIHPNIDESEIMDKDNSGDLPPVHGENPNYEEYDLEDSQTMLEESKSNFKGNDVEPEELQNSEEIIDIDLTDPDVEKAAVKIQSAFKGFKTRKANEDAPIATVTNDEENPEETQTGDESQHFATDEENFGGSEAAGHGDFIETNEKVIESLEFDHENQEVPTDEITNVTDNIMNEAEQIADEEIAKSSIDSMEKLYVDDLQHSIDVTEIKDEEVNNDVEEVQQSLDLNETVDEIDKNNIGDISEVNDDTINTDRITERSQENIEEDTEINFEQNEEVPIDEEHKQEVDEESVSVSNIEIDKNVEQIEQQAEQEEIEDIESHREENTERMETHMEDHTEEKEDIESHREENTERMETRMEDHTEENEDVSNILEEHSEKPEESTIPLGDEIYPEEPEDTINETAAEAVDTERTVGNNDLEDSVIEQEESNQVETNPTHEDNQESGGPTNDTDEAGTSRTEPDE